MPIIVEIIEIIAEIKEIFAEIPIDDCRYHFSLNNPLQ